MKFFIINILKKLRQWTLNWAQSKYVVPALFFIAFIESFIFPIPADVLLVAILLTGATRWFYYAGIAMAGSVLGAPIGYLIGWGFYEIIGRHIVELYNLQNAVAFIGEKFSQHAFLTIFTIAIIPMFPFKIITISSGLFKVPFLKMILAAVAGRTIRYSIVAFITKTFRGKIRKKDEEEIFS